MRGTIFALATAPGRAAVAVMRLSGPGAGEAVRTLSGGRPLPPPRGAAVRRLSDPANGQPIDEALVVWFAGPASFTGEDVAELQLHGGPAVVDAAAAALVCLGLRLAEPGEFTRRAFENGRLELSQAEAIADLVDAETSAQRRQAIDQLGGALARRYEAWRAELIEALSWLEAEIDFPDEALPDRLAVEAGAPLDRLTAAIEASLSDARGERVRDGFRVALIGAPNAGKSSLFNALLLRDAAIVTPTPGTTRDVIEAPLTIDGFRVLLADTAGVRASTDLIEAEGIRRARAWAEAADLRLWVVDRGASEGAWREAAELVRPYDLLVLSKADSPPGSDAAAASQATEQRVEATTTGSEGIVCLQTALASRVRAALGGTDFPATTRLRHRALLEETLAHLRRALQRLPSGDAELVAEDVRLAARALERIAGRIDPEAGAGQSVCEFLHRQVSVSRETVRWATCGCFT